MAACLDPLAWRRPVCAGSGPAYLCTADGGGTMAPHIRPGRRNFGSGIESRTNNIACW